MKLIASVDGTRHEIPDASLADLVAFERHFGISSSVLEGEAPEIPDDADEETKRALREQIREAALKMRVEWIAFIIYRGLIRLGVFERSLDFESALDRIEDFDMEDEDETEAGVDPSSAPSANDSEPVAS